MDKMVAEEAKEGVMMLLSMGTLRFKFLIKLHQNKSDTPPLYSKPIGEVKSSNEAIVTEATMEEFEAVRRQFQKGNHKPHSKMV